LILESERRWADWQGGQPIELPDGQAWFFFQPEARMRGLRPGWTFGVGVPSDVDAILSDRLVRILRKCGRATCEADKTAAILEAAWFLLARNYEITPDEFEGILSGASAWSADQQQRLGSQLLELVGIACARSTALAEVA
jgi:hypothetical protein